MPARAVLVDSDAAARKQLRDFLLVYPEVIVSAESEGGPQVADLINGLVPDLVFLAAGAPDDPHNGFAVLDALTCSPDVIFGATSTELAYQAFKEGAVDYLLKPYRQEMFNNAVERFLEQYQAHSPAQVAALLEAFSGRGEELEQVYPKRLFVRAGDRILPVDVNDILWAEAAGDYTKLHTCTSAYLCSLGIGDLEGRLHPQRFMRVHRSYIVALHALSHLVSDGSGGYLLTLDDGGEVRVSRSYANEIRKRVL